MVVSVGTLYLYRYVYTYWLAHQQHVIIKQGFLYFTTHHFTVPCTLTVMSITSVVLFKTRFFFVTRIYVYVLVTF